MSSCFKTHGLIGWIAGLLLLLSIESSVALEPPPGIYRERTPVAVDVDFSALGLKDCQSVRALDTAHALAVCRQANDKAAPGLQLFLVDTQSSKPISRLLHSSDFGDAYYVKVTVLRNDQGRGPDVVLAESGAEFSYGVQVYTFEGSELHAVGAIHEVLDDEGNASSVIPALHIQDTGQVLLFSFTKNVMLPDRRGSYTEIASERIHYVLDGLKLRRVFSPQKSRPSS